MTETPTPERVPMSEVRQAAKAAGSHFFDPDTTRFFRSRYANDAIRLDVDDTRLWVFWTSEQMVHLDGTKEPRGWTIRVRVDGQREFIRVPDDDPAHGVFDFQAFDSLGAVCSAIFGEAIPYLIERFR